MQNLPSSKKPISVVVVGQTPPPFHGQAIMIQMLLQGPVEGVALHHVRMAFSENMDQVGRFQLGKIFHLFGLIVRIIVARFKHRATILYYPPAGPNRIPVLRDILLLTCTRWLFRQTVFHFHAQGISELLPRLPGPLRAMAKWALGKPEATIQLSDRTGQDAQYLQTQRAFVIPNAVLDEAQRLNFDPNLRHPSKTPRLLYVGTVCEGKGILVLLEACRRLKQEHRDFHLDVIGSFQPQEFSSTVEDTIQKLDLSSHVTLHGQKTGDDKWRMFCEADVFCFPSHYQSEGVPCVLIEAMCFSLPVVSTRWRGIPSIVEEGSTGHLVEVQDVAALASALDELICHPESRREMGKAGRDRFLTHFSHRQYLDNMRALFAEMSQRHHP